LEVRRAGAGGCAGPEETAAVANSQHGVHLVVRDGGGGAAASAAPAGVIISMR
jgi:hypothetical protein